MDELHRFLFEGLPVRGALVRLTDGWREVRQRRQDAGAYAPPLRALLGEMAAAACLMQAHIKFNGALILQVFGDGPVRLAVAEVQSDLTYRATAQAVDTIAADARLAAMVNVHGRGRCAITLDPRDRLPGQQPYQGVVPLAGPDHARFQDLAQVLQHYMRQSEQLETTFVLAADDEIAAGLVIQRLPVQGEGNLEAAADRPDEDAGFDEHYNRIAHLAASLTREELLGLPVDQVLHRLFWEEKLLRFEPQQPRFACSCSRERVGRMLASLGRKEAEEIVAERGMVEIGCEFCGRQYRFDAVDVEQVFTALQNAPPGPPTLQ